MDTLLRLGLSNALAAGALALLAAGVSRVVRNPALAHSLWLLVLLRLLAPPLWSVFLPWPAPAEATPERGRVEDASAPPSDGPPAAPAPASGRASEAASEMPAREGGDAVPPGPAPALPAPAAVEPAPPPPVPAPAEVRPWGSSWETPLVALWLAGSLLWWALAGIRLRRFRRCLRCARPAAAVQDRARRLAGRLGLSRCPGVWLLPASVSPMLWAWGGQPRLLLPDALWERLTEGQQDTLLAHELAHLRRRDHWVRRLELLALGLYWWHPVAWWARQRLEEAEEQCCDAWVVWALPGEAPAYAEALLHTVAFLSGPQPALPSGASGMGQVPLLQRRLSMILRGKTPRALTWAGLTAVLGLAALVLPLLPTWAETPPHQGGAADRPAPGSVEVEVTVPRSDAGPGGIVVLTPDPARGRVAITPPRPAERVVVAPDGLTRARAPVPVGAADTPGGPQEAADAVDLLRVQVREKQADLQEAKVLLDQARRQLDRTTQLHQKGAADEGALEQARSQVEVLQARLVGKEAQLQEAELRLKQAERRLVDQRGAGRDGGQPRNPAPRTTPPAAPGGPAVAPPVRSGRANAEQRVRDLEKRLEALSQEVEALKRELEQYPSAVPAPSYRIVPAPPPNERADPRNTPTVPLAPPERERPSAPQPAPVEPPR